MKRRRSLCTPILIGLLLISAFWGCSSAPPEPLRVGYSVWPGYEALYLAEQKNFFREEKAPILLKDFTSFSDLKKALQVGRLEGAAIKINEMFLSHLGKSYRVVLALDESFGADGIVGQHGINSIQELKGKRVGVEMSGLGAYLLKRALERAGLRMSDIIPVNMTPNLEGYNAFIEKKVDAVVTLDPNLGRLLREAHGRLLFSSQEIPTEVIDVLIFREDILRTRREDCIKVIRAYFRALDFWKRRPDEALAIMARREQVSTDIFRASFAGLRIPNLPANRYYFGLSKNENYFLTTVKSFQDFMKESNLPLEEIYFEDLLSGIKERPV